MNIIDHLSWRYATKNFNESQLINPESLQILCDAFNLTATSYGLQPIKLVVIQDKKLQASLVTHSMNQQQVAQASHVFVFCIETNIDKAFILNYFNRVKQLRNTPDAILQPFRDFLIEDFSNKQQEAIEDWATKQAYLAMGNMLTVCATQGVDACPMEGFNPNKYDEILDLKTKGLKSVLIMPIGYRAEDDIFAGFKKVRKKVSESVIIHKQ
ncbi:NAD(P)H-dependent oxidoreductase [Oceanihabitans sp. 2_MG-2023]|uniref:NAD(P)H-dependent oxidoreductase n=1 Tax=Oceanihabitans sp. 2_MG-2023 TaxID=3062661 RepID=UPI0026E3BFDC|nr:NAD(P)H-dependent oxidoreductase [Oceanihabitans sp. 2_MG-2023]MDO6597270.1 NAD(P)H-dependent oxidoreductase [Oceanihabitans sp. 2_MG-2023]